MKNRKNIIGEAEIKNAYKILASYREGKRSLEQRIIDNEEWFKMRCCGIKNSEEEINQSSAWLFNSIINKHADAMDSFPEPNVLPREESDVKDAKELSKILPVILEQCNFEQTYSDVWWYKLKTGTGVYGVFWNSSLEGGLGDIDIKQIDILNLFWEPNIKYIEESENLFYAQAVDRKKLLREYPFAEAGLKNAEFELEAYNRENGAVDNDRVLVVDWYYKKKVKGREVLHYCKFAGNNVLFASENEDEYRERGFYDHGKYPVVFDTMFVTENSPAGFGYIDVMKGCQRTIDRLDSAILRNTLMAENPRWFISDAAGINEEEYADWTTPFIHTTGRIDDQTLKQVEVNGINNIALELLNYKVAELKETSGNRDFSQGSTNFGVTAASAILALQEAGGKLSRDMIKSSFRAYSKICYLMVELIRQFYTEPRCFRISGNGENNSFLIYKSDSISQKSGINLLGDTKLFRRPIFDIRIVPQKQNPYQKARQNELAKELFGLGMLSEERREEAKLAVKMMDFEGKEELLQSLSF